MLHVHLTTEYLASFTVSQMWLGLGEGALGLLQTGSRVLVALAFDPFYALLYLIQVLGEEKIPLISKLQRGVRAVRRAGIKRAGTTK